MSVNGELLVTKTLANIAGEYKRNVHMIRGFDNLAVPATVSANAHACGV